MTRLSDAELKVIRERPSYSNWKILNKDQKSLLAEIDRLREGERLAREWAKASAEFDKTEQDDDADFYEQDDAESTRDKAREAFRAWAVKT